jgi:dTDP-4-amino-4,6-dideoxygalactose transaminase
MEEVTMNPMNPHGDANNWLSCLTIDESCKVQYTQVLDALEAENIEARPIWKPMHLQPVFAGCDFISEKEGVSVGQKIFEHGFCLPSDIKNTSQDMERIISIVRGCFGK